jgi:hypothetical protein
MYSRLSSEWQRRINSKTVKEKILLPTPCVLFAYVGTQLISEINDIGLSLITEPLVAD